jgi:hypothetical protein
VILLPWIEQASKRLHRNMALKRRLLRIRGNEAAALSVAHRHHL